MSLGGKIMNLFPAAHAAAIAASLFCAVHEPTILSLASVPAATYLLPLILYRAHGVFWPLQEGVYDLGASRYNPWWGTYNLQLVFNALPGIERLLMLIPGLYQLWLRAWGSKIGKGAFFAINVVNFDRGLLEIGDGVVTGANVIYCPHAITPKNGKQVLIIEKIRVGAGSFVGAETKLGPGAVVEAGSFVPFNSIVSRITPKINK